MAKGGLGVDTTQLMEEPGKPKRPRLWAGFDKVTPRAEAAHAADMEQRAGVAEGHVEAIAPANLTANPFQARVFFDEEALEGLAESMRQHGFFGTLAVRPTPGEPGTYQLVYGERRWRAAQRAGLATIPCVVKPYSDEQLLELGLVENIQRENLNPLEEGRAFRGVMKERGWSVRSLAARIGKSASYTQERLHLLEMPKDVQALIQQRPDALRAARDLAKVTDPRARKAMIADLLKGQIASRDVTKARGKRERQEAEGEGDAATQRRIEALQRAQQRIIKDLRAWETRLGQMGADERSQLDAALYEIIKLASELHRKV